MKYLRNHLSLVLALTLIGGVAAAGAIKTFTTETLTASDLNTVLQHIHNAMVGGHGARLVNADVSASAAISHSKLATPALVPKAFAAVLAACGSSPCTVASSSGVSAITRASAGSYTVTFTNARANANYAVLASQHTTGIFECRVETIVAASFAVICFNSAGTATDSAFSVMVMDNDN